MLPEQWEIFKRAVRREKLDKIPMALIIDSPWIPGYLGIKHLDYFLDPELWFQSNLKIMREFPDIIFVPSWWMEYGMAAEPSVLGAKIKFWQDNTPSEYHTLYHLEDMDSLPEYEVEADAFAGADAAPHRDAQAAHPGPRLHSADGHVARPAVHRRVSSAARPNFMIDLVENPEGGAQADRPLHARDHRLAEGAAEGHGGHGGGHLHPGRHRRVHQRGALPGVRPPVPEAHLRRVPRRTG